MSKIKKDRSLTIADLFEFVKNNKIPLDSVIFMRPKNEEVFLVNRIGSGEFISQSDNSNFRFIMMDALLADSLKKETIQ